VAPPASIIHAIPSRHIPLEALRKEYPVGTGKGCSWINRARISGAPSPSAHPISAIALRHGRQQL